jgi:hypothetical protein
VGDRQQRSPHLHPLGANRGTAVKLQPGWTATADDLDVLPQHAARVAGAERLHRRFVGGKSPRQVRSGISPASTISNLASSEHALQEAFAVALEHVGEPGDIGGVEADAENVHDLATA